MPKPLSILYISYPLLTVSEESAGGAEQMLHALEYEMARLGHSTTVAASRGSRVHGQLLITGDAVAETDAYERREAEHSERILEYLRSHPHEFDLVHDKSGGFFRHAAECSLPVLATLHLPRTFYDEQWLRDVPGTLYFNGVSESQVQTFAGVPRMLGVVQNGIRIAEARYCTRKQPAVGWLGRICEEKAPHLAIAAAKQAGVPLMLAGQVYPFSYHQQYFEREVRPWVDSDGVRFIESPTQEQKEAVLNSRAVLLTSTVAETSSLVAIEAMARGTPVIAFRRGAFPEIVTDGRTGCIVDSVDEMAEAIREIEKIRPEDCRREAEERFTSERMAREYEELYREVLRGNVTT